MFPTDFFQNSKKEENLECESTFSTPKVENRKSNGIKIVIDLEKELEEDRELLEMLSPPPKVNILPHGSFNKSKNIHNLKSTGFEMIPEEDEEKLKTVYETSNKFFDANKLCLKDEKSSDFMDSHPCEGNSEHYVNFSRLSPYLPDSLKTSQRIYSSESAVKTKNNRPDLSREKSLGSFSTTNEYTNDSGKRRFSGHNKEDKSKQISHNIFDSSKLNLLPLSAGRKGKFQFSKSDDFNFDSNFLPIISERKRLDGDIKSIFEEADNFKEDSFIKKKLDSIIQNISDIREVLNKKSKLKYKMVSEQNNIEEAKTELPNFKIYNDELNVEDNKLIDTKGIRLRSNLKSVFSLREKKKLKFSNFSTNLTNIKNNNNLSANISSNLHFILKKDKVPIKLMKKEMNFL